MSSKQPPRPPHRTVIGSWEQGQADRTYQRVYQAQCACGWRTEPDPNILHTRLHAARHLNQEDT